jgi:hypothetical protein
MGRATTVCHDCLSLLPSNTQNDILSASKPLDSFIELLQEARLAKQCEPAQLLVGHGIFLLVKPSFEPTTTIQGVAFLEQIVPGVPVDDHDHQLDSIITPEQIVLRTSA